MDNLLNTAGAAGQPAAFTNGDGIIYVLRSDDGTLAKPGMTVSGTPMKRAMHYGREHGHTWIVHWFADIRLAYQVETAIHRELAAHRVATDTNAKEIFAVAADLARDVAIKHLRPRKTIDEARSDVIAALLRDCERQDNQRRFDSARIRMQNQNHGEWRGRGRFRKFRPYWRDDHRVRAQMLAADEKKLNHERAKIRAWAGALADAEVRVEAAQIELEQIQKHRQAEQAQIDRQQRDQQREAEQQAEAARQQQRRVAYEQIVAQWDIYAGHWARQASAAQAQLDAYHRQTVFARAANRLAGQSPVVALRRHIHHAREEGGTAEQQAALLRKQAGPSLRAWTEYHRAVQCVERQVEEAEKKGIYLDLMWPVQPPWPQPPPVQPTGEAANSEAEMEAIARVFRYVLK